jgi:S-DNA-T family DNA segregation ATPase FtsK/SpoIIIE
MAATKRIARSERPPLLPAHARVVVRRRIAEVIGFALIAAGFLLAAALATYDRYDPSWNMAAIPGTPVRNVLGPAGAYLSDALLQALGAGAYGLALMLTAAGLRTASQRKPGSWAVRVLTVLVATLLASAAAAGLPAGDGWVLHHDHRGGVLGAVLLSLLVDIEGATVGNLGRSAVALGAGGLAALLALATLGLSPLDAVRGAARTAARIAGLARSAAPAAGAGARAAAAAGLAVGGVLAGAAAKGAGAALRRAPTLAPEAVPAAPAGPTTAERAAERLRGLRVPPSPPSSARPAGEAPSRGPTVVGPARPDAPRRQGGSAVQQSLGFDAADEGARPPPLDLLQAADPTARSAVLDEGALQENAALLEGVLADFGVRGRIVKVSPGPVVTLYELEPAPGTKSSRVIGLADDIARSMSAVSARVAVVPGRNVIGIELPNVRREMVYLRELLEADAYAKAGHRLPLVLGKDISGAPVVADLARMPHLLIAGTTGSGKSVGINTMILSLLYRLPPEKVRFIMVDPKMLELSVYEGIPHLLAPVVTDPKKAVTALKWTVREMEDRYRAMSKLGVRNIEGYNARLAEAKARGEVLTRKVQTGFDPDTGKPVFEDSPIDLNELPWIVVVVDEMADLMLVAGKEIEGAIQRLAQMARAAGIHIVMATQRPSVDVITGTIKANFPTRISFMVTSRIDSRTILGEQGAEQLLGQGDMLHMASGGRIVRVHGPYVRDDEVEKVVAFLKTQGEPAYVDAVLEDDDEEGAGPDAGEGMGGEAADLYDQAVAVVVRDRKASTSYVQRRLGIGYNRAASLIERMEAEGVVSRPNHSGKREILVGGE